MEYLKIPFNDSLLLFLPFSISLDSTDLDILVLKKTVLPSRFHSIGKSLI